MTENTHQVIKDTSLVWEPKDIETTFSYTESHIRHTLIPQLRELKSIATSDNNPSLITKYENSINTWEYILFLNDSLKDASTFKKNLSFSAGAPYKATFTDESGSLYSYDYSIFLEAEVAIGAGVVSLGTPYEAGIRIKAGFKYQRIDESSTTLKTTTGYTLSDDDPGDFFSIDIRHDDVFATPVFELVAGRSSNLWEKAASRAMV